MSEFLRALRLLHIIGLRRFIRAARIPYPSDYMAASGARTARRILGAPEGWTYSDCGIKALLATNRAVDPGQAGQAAEFLYDLHHDPAGIADLERMAAEQKANTAAFHAKMAELDKFRTVPLYAPQQIEKFLQARL